QQPLLGGRPQPGGLRRRGRRLRRRRLPAAERLNLGGVHASLARPAPRHPALPARPPARRLRANVMRKQAANPYETGLDKNAANYVPMSPIGFLLRSAAVYPNRTSVIHGEQRYTWRETLERCRRLASALAKRGVRAGDTVAVMAPNVPAAFEAHFGVPMAGAVLNALNIRLDAETIAFILKHGAAKVLLTDGEFAPVVKRALAQLDTKPLVIDIADPLGPDGERLGQVDYETFLASGDPNFTELTPVNEWDAIALNYTSGTTGNPKGVVYHHRGAY